MDYADIKTIALSYSDRADDAEVIARLDNFIGIVEARVNRALRVADMSMRATLVAADQEYYGLPVDFGGLRDAEYQTADGVKCTMKYLAPDLMNVVSNVGSTAFIYYTIVAGQLQIQPIKDTGTFEIVYYQRIPGLTSGNTTNWLGDDNPDCYIFGLMVEISAFVKNAEAAALWDDRFKGVIAEIEHEDQIIRWSGPSLQTHNG